MTADELLASLIADQVAQGIVHPPRVKREPGISNRHITGQPDWQSVHELGGRCKVALFKTREEAMNAIAEQNRNNAGIYYVRQWENGEWHFDCHVIPESSKYYKKRVGAS